MRSTKGETGQNEDKEEYTPPYMVIFTAISTSYTPMLVEYLKQLLQ